MIAFMQERALVNDLIHSNRPFIVGSRKIPAFVDSSLHVKSNPTRETYIVIPGAAESILRATVDDAVT